MAFERPDEVRRAFRDYTSTGVDFADALLGSIGQALGCETTITLDRRAGKLEAFTVVG